MLCRTFQTSPSDLTNSIWHSKLVSTKLSHIKQFARQICLACGQASPGLGRIRAPVGLLGVLVVVADVGYSEIAKVVSRIVDLNCNTFKTLHSKGSKFQALFLSIPRSLQPTLHHCLNRSIIAWPSPVRGQSSAHELSRGLPLTYARSSVKQCCIQPLLQQPRQVCGSTATSGQLAFGDVHPVCLPPPAARVFAQTISCPKGTKAQRRRLLRHIHQIAPKEPHARCRCVQMQVQCRKLDNIVRSQTVC